MTFPVWIERHPRALLGGSTTPEPQDLGTYEAPTFYQACAQAMNRHGWTALDCYGLRFGQSAEELRPR